MVNSVVIVGAGQAGYQTAISLRQEGFTGTITLIGDEEGVPYQRPPLSKAYLLGKLDKDGLAFRPAEYYGEQKVDLVHAKATAIDRANRQVLVDTGSTYYYDHLVLATGAHNRPLSVTGAELVGVHGLRSLSDADVLKTRLDQFRDVVVVGGGFIGLEFAAVAKQLGARVHLLELADRLMARAVSREMSGFFAQAHAGWGVELHLFTGLSRIKGKDGRVVGVETIGGKVLPADLVVYGIGVLPNVRLAVEAGLDVDNGIVVDSFLLTSDPAISAIGDCACFPSQYAGEVIRLESVQNASDQGRTVAARLMGKRAAYAALPWFWSDQGDLKLQMVGLSAGYDETVVLGGIESRAFTVLLFRRNQLIAVECVNRAGDFMAARKMMSRQVNLSPQLATAVGFDLRAWEAANR
ncbi:NAD(P)/FAD-dependent oxidoreductase [Paracoccus pantotrophus]|uniref:NAD(P)/FAD-dependent oxidoreductase n=1 Tax=Paracoccus pantotrophus TaxID=82367 RepID=UPI0004B490A2|nr:FAD-dependent oxidoreductase [Paracoccus pantotrophus]